jgi:hypothetical protein
LSDEDFKQVFKINRTEYAQMKRWKQSQLKKLMTVEPKAVSLSATAPGGEES